VQNEHRGHVWLLAGAAGVSVANLYYAQPLAPMMARDLGVRERTLGFALTLAQVGYALGMLLLVPLGDVRERRGLLVATSFAAALSLVGVALGPGFAVVAAASLVMGFASSLPQMILPFAVGLAKPASRGAVIGTVMGGLLAGILLSRTAAGALGRLIGWRGTFALGAVLMAALAVVLRVALPVQRPSERLSYGALLRSMLGLLRDQPLLRRHGLLGALSMAGFSAFWSMLAFHLARNGHGSEVAGGFGMVGIVGVLVAPLVGRLAHRVESRVLNGVSLAVVALSFLTFHLVGASLIGIALGVVLLDCGAQANHLANQTVIYGLAPELRNRLNAVYMVSFFIGGASGSALAALAWSRAGWPGVCAVGGACAVIGLLLVLMQAPAPNFASDAAK
jgi:predicted MFS family arabinose efflux permease